MGNPYALHERDQRPLKQKTVAGKRIYNCKNSRLFVGVATREVKMDIIHEVKMNILRVSN